MKRWAWLLPLLAVAAIFAIRVTGPPDFLDKDQPRPIDYVVDALADGNWVVQRDAGGGVTSKPPLYTWMAAAASAAFGGNRFALYLPCALAMAALSLTAYVLARRRLGLAAGLAAAMALALSVDLQKAIVLARTDAVFAACVAGAAWLALRAWEGGRGWWLFWAACGVVCIAKSPVGIAFAAGGLLAAWWGRGDPAPARRRPGGRWREHALGLAIMLAIAGGWFAWAVAALGQPVVDRMLGRELIGHAVANDKGAPLWRTLPQPLLWFAGLFLPWSIALGAALWRLARHPPASPRRRRFLRFMACWLGAGLLLLCFAPHKRMVLALPMLLPAAILAGAEIGRWLARTPWRRQALAWAAVAAVAAAAQFAYHHRLRDHAKDRVRESEAVLAAAAELDAWAACGVRVGLHRGVPSSLRYFAAGHPPLLDAAAAARLLAEPGPGAVAVEEGTALDGIRVPLADGFELVLDGDAAALRP